MSQARPAEWPILAVIAVFLLMWVVVDPVGEFPINDDWAYSFAVRSILEHGQFRLTGFSAPNLIVQAYWGAMFCLPFGFSQTALRVSTLVLAVAGLWFAYRLMREIGAERGVAAIAAATLGWSPIHLVLSTSFMTDVPFTALICCSFWFYIRGVNRGSGALLTGAFAVAFVATFIRQFGIFLPLAFGVSLLLRRGVRVSTLALAGLPVLGFVAAHLGFQQWILDTGRAPRFAQSVQALATTASFRTLLPHLRIFIVAMIPYFGLSILVFLFACLLGQPWRRPVRRTMWLWSAVFLLGAAISLLLASEGRLLPSLGGVLYRFGIGPLTLRDAYIMQVNVPVVPGARPFWIGLTIASACATATLAVFTVRSVPSLWTALRRGTDDAVIWQQGLFLTFLVGYSAAVLVALTLDNVFDRYFVPLVIPLCGLLYLWLQPGDLGTKWIGVAWTPALAAAALAVLAVHDYFGFTHARWAALARLQQAGIPVTSIDGGFEFNGLTQYDVAYQRNGRATGWWVNDDEYLISLGPVPGFTVIATSSFPHWLWPASSNVETLRRNGS